MCGHPTFAGRKCSPTYNNPAERRLNFFHGPRLEQHKVERGCRMYNTYSRACVCVSFKSAVGLCSPTRAARSYHGTSEFVIFSSCFVAADSSAVGWFLIRNIRNIEIDCRTPGNFAERIAIAHRRECFQIFTHVSRFGVAEKVSTERSFDGREYVGQFV